jgi:ligand-binding sensor domain-containing protein
VVTETDSAIWIIYQARNDVYWFGSDGQGVYCYDGKTLRHFTTKHGLVNDRVREIKEDKTGNIYINTLFGISKYDGVKFTTLAVEDSSNNWQLQANDLWFKSGTGKTKGGPYRYDGKTLYSLQLPHHPMEDDYNRRFPGTKYIYTPYDIYTIYKDRKGHIWFGTGAFGIYRYDGKSVSNMYEQHLSEIEGGGSFGIRSIIEDKDGKYWFCNTKYRYDIAPGHTNGSVNYKRENGIENLKAPDGTDRIYFQYVAQDEKRNLWLSTYRWGVWVYDGKNTTHYTVKDGDKDIAVISLYKDNHGGMWLGTEKNGLYKFNGRSFEKHRF